MAFKLETLDQLLESNQTYDILRLKWVINCGPAMWCQTYVGITQAVKEVKSGGLVQKE
jgi:hypothetical protein